MCLYANSGRFSNLCAVEDIMNPSIQLWKMYIPNEHELTFNNHGKILFVPFDILFHLIFCSI